MIELSMYDQEELDFLRENAVADPVKLSLKFHNSPGKKELIAQISARQKLRKKLLEWVHNEQIRFPVGLPLEQASSETTARLKASLTSGKKLIDLTGGLGVDCYYLSQSFKHSCYIDNQETLAAHAQYNFTVLNARIEVQQSLAEVEIRNTDADVVYLDPHRRGRGNKKQFLLTDHQPNVLDILPELIRGQRKTLIKTSPMLDIQHAIKQLKYVSEIWVISIGNECKEVVYKLESEAGAVPVIRTWNQAGQKWQHYQEQAAKDQHPELGSPQQYLYEPNSSILKAGLQDQISIKLNIKKLHPNSHLYTSDEFLADYPGRIFEVQKILKPWDREIKGGRYNVISRNFHENASIIEKKMKLKPAREDFLIASKLSDKRAVFIVARLLGTAE
jgi:16S rRNA G966 N2-methylase RsmD